MSENPFTYRGEDAADARHNSGSVGAQDRHAEVVGGTPVHIDRSRLAESVAARDAEVGRTRTVIPYGHPDNVVTQVEKMRAAIKTALRGLLDLGEQSDEDAEKLHAIADGLIEAL